MGILEFLNGHPIPVSIISTVLIMWALNSFIFPHLPSLHSWFSAAKDQQIKELIKRVNKLEEDYIKLQTENNKLLKDLANTKAKENQMLGLLRGLSHQLKSVGVDISEELKQIQNI